MKKRLLTLLMATLLMVSVFTGCTGSNSEKEANMDKDSTKVETPKDISFITPWPIPQVILDKFKEKTGIEVKMDVVANSTQEYKQARNARMAAGQDLDIIGVDGPDVAQFAKDGIVIELTGEEWMSNFSGEALKLMSKYSETPDKQFYSVYETLLFGVWYNKDIFNEYGIEVPTNYEEFIAVCDTLKANDVYPLVQGAKDTWPMDQELNFLTEAIYNKSPELYIDLYSGATKWTDDLVANEAKKLEVFYPEKEYYLPGALSTTYDQAWQLMLKQEAAMWVMGSWAVEVMTKSNVAPDFEVGVFNPPFNYEGEDQFSAKMLARNFGILAKSEKQDAAKQFLAFLTEPDIAKIFVDEGMAVSTIKDVVSDTVVAAEDWAKIMSLPNGGQNMLVKVDSNGNTYDQGPEFLKIKNSLEANLISGEWTVDQYLEALQEAQDKDNANYGK